MNKATFAAGCFWSVEQKFKETTGVTSTQVGYMGGQTQNPSYEQVCTGETGHAEVVDITFNPDEVSFEKLLEIFWHLHDPTTLNQQGPDIGTQYRSALFFHSQEQQEAALKSMSNRQQEIGRTIVTEVTKASTFYKAEEYHQCYLEKNGIGTCKI